MENQADLNRYFSLKFLINITSISIAIKIMTLLFSYFGHYGFSFTNPETWSYFFLYSFIFMISMIILEKIYRNYEKNHSESQMIKLNRLAFKGNIAILIGLFLVVINHLLF